MGKCLRQRCGSTRGPEAPISPTVERRKKRCPCVLCAPRQQENDHREAPQAPHERALLTEGWQVPRPRRCPCHFLGLRSTLHMSDTPSGWVAQGNRVKVPEENTERHLTGLVCAPPTSPEDQPPNTLGTKGGGEGPLTTTSVKIVLGNRSKCDVQQGAGKSLRTQN